MGEKKYAEMAWTYCKDGSTEFVKKVFVREGVGPNSIGRPSERLKDRVKEYMCKKDATREGRLNQARKECLNRERLRLFCCGHPLGEHSRSKQDVRAMDRQIGNFY